MSDDTPLRYAFIAPALFGISLFAAGLGTLALGLPDDIAHAISSLIVLAVMVWLYRSAGFEASGLGVSGVPGCPNHRTVLSTSLKLTYFKPISNCLEFQRNRRVRCNRRNTVRKTPEL
mgnify:CR=1 FL=1